MRFASPRRAWSGDVLDGSGCGRRAHLRAAAAVAPIYERLPLRARDAEKHGHRPYNVSRKKQQALRRGTEGLPSGGESDLGQRLV